MIGIRHNSKEFNELKSNHFFDQEPTEENTFAICQKCGMQILHLSFKNGNKIWIDYDDSGSKDIAMSCKEFSMREALE